MDTVVSILALITRKWTPPYLNPPLGSGGPAAKGPTKTLRAEADVLNLNYDLLSVFSGRILNVGNNIGPNAKRAVSC